MSGSFILGVLTAIEATSSRKEKEERLRNVAHIDMIKEAFYYAYNPQISFGIDKTTMPDEKGREGGVDLNWQEHKYSKGVLDRLANRTLTGGDAVEAVRDQLSLYNPHSAELYKRIILKDLRCGIGESTINKVWPGLIPTFPYMRCSLPDKSNMDKWDWSRGVYSQEKADGMFVTVEKNFFERIKVYSRQGSIIPDSDEFDEIHAYFERLPNGYHYHGEILVKKHGVVLPREQSNGQINSLLSGGRLDEHCDLFIKLWDMIPNGGIRAGNFKSPYYVRWDLLKGSHKVAAEKFSVSPVQLVETRIVCSKEAAMEHCVELLAEGKEGTILKCAGAIWKDGTSKDQVKLKLEVDVELEVLDFQEGEGKYQETLGALVCGSSDGKLVVNVNGRTDAMRDEVWANRLDWLGAVVTVRANSLMKSTKEGEPASLFLPRFIERRTDKKAADTLEQIEAQFTNAVRSF